MQMSVCLKKNCNFLPLNVFNPRRWLPSANKQEAESHPADGQKEWCVRQGETVLYADRQTAVSGYIVHNATVS